MRWQINIRTKLLLVMGGLLVVSGGLSLLLHLREGKRIRQEFESMIRQVVGRLIEETGPEGFLANGGRVVREMEERYVPYYDFDSQEWTVRVEKRVDLVWLYGEHPSTGELIPPGSLETLVLDDLKDPIEEVRSETVPRELLIAGSVLLVGLGLMWFLARRLTGPIKSLTESMEDVASGDLDVHVEPRTRDEVRQMSVAFNTMVERLREKQELEKKMSHAERLSAMGDLAAGVAHDIRNPLNTIGLNLDHLGSRFSPEDPGERERFLAHITDIKKELGRLNELVRSFLSLAHPERGEKVPCDLRELVRDTLRLFRKEAESKGVEIRTRLEDAGETVVDPQQIRGALTNVVLNALRAMEDGGGELEVELFRRWRPVAAERDASEEVVLAVSDTGCGIEGKNLERVFLPYFTTREDGTGLGLPIALRSVEAHGGRIEIESRPGEGSRVEITLPCRGAGELVGARPDEEGGAS